MCLTLVYCRRFSPDILGRDFDHELAAADSPAHCRSKIDSPTVWHLRTRGECSGVVQSFPVLGNAEAAAQDGEYVLSSSNGAFRGRGGDAGFWSWSLEEETECGGEVLGPRLTPLDFILKRLGWDGQEERYLRDLASFEGIWVQCRLGERLELKKHTRGCCWTVAEVWAVKCLPHKQVDQSSDP